MVLPWSPKCWDYTNVLLHQLHFRREVLVLSDISRGPRREDLGSLALVLDSPYALLRHPRAT